MSRRAARRSAVSIAVSVLPALTIVALWRHTPPPLPASAEPAPAAAVSNQPAIQAHLVTLSVAAAGDYQHHVELDAFYAQVAAQAAADRAAVVAAVAKAKEAVARAAALAAEPRPAVRVAPSVPSLFYEGGTLPALLHAIRNCESGGNYLRLNQSGSDASGAFQVLDSTWRSWRNLVAGAGSYARAFQAPPEIQDAVAVAAYAADGTAPWLASRGCWR